ncbi:MAG: MopE-related protein [Gemmatimonadales bacterium]
MRFLVLLLLLTGCRAERLNPVSECGQPCFPGDPEIGMAGACRSGTWRCEEDGGRTCEGWVGPKTEECNGLDDDCDGRVDAYMHDNPRRCQSSCGIGVEQCILGRWTPCSAPAPKPETCNGRDDDCDGRSDEPEDLVSKPCWTGAPPADPQFGICHGGSTRCSAGQEVCFGQQLPRTEVCNGIDDDCDGQIDEGAGANDLLDFVLVFDNSCSMSGVAAGTKAATQTWVSKYGTNVLRRYALVVAPDNDLLISFPRIDQDFTDTVGFAAAVGRQTGLTGTGAEPTLDAVSRIIDDQLAPLLPRVDGGLGLSWRSGSNRVLVVFSDEYPQSYAPGCYGLCQPLATDVANRLTLGGLKLYVFTRTDYDVWTPWLQLSSAGRGRNRDITAAPLDLEQFLDDLLREVTCQP